MNADISDLVNHIKMLNRETPFFITGRDILRANYEEYKECFPDADIFYALKANSDPSILNYLDMLGSGFEAASEFEVNLLIKLGVDPKKIIYGTSVKPEKHIRTSYNAGIRVFAADSKEEITKIASCAPDAKVYVRAMVDDTGSVFTMSEKFGAPPHYLADLILYAKHLGLKTYGISFYVGSQATHSDRWAKGIQTIMPSVYQLMQEGVTLEVINIGGGFPVVYDNLPQAPILQDIAYQIHAALRSLPYQPRLIMEPGRGLVATSTILATRIIAKVERHGKKWLYVDGGIYNALYEAMIHQGATQYPVYALNNEAVDIHNIVPYTIAGPTGDSLDVITRDVLLPSYLTIGDIIVFANAGAYTLSVCSRFNGFPQPELYLV